MLRTKKCHRLVSILRRIHLFKFYRSTRAFEFMEGAMLIIIDKKLLLNKEIME